MTVCCRKDLLTDSLGRFEPKEIVCRLTVITFECARIKVTVGIRVEQQFVIFTVVAAPAIRLEHVQWRIELAGKVSRWHGRALQVIVRLDQQVTAVRRTVVHHHLLAVDRGLDKAILWRLRHFIQILQTHALQQLVQLPARYMFREFLHALPVDRHCFLQVRVLRLQGTNFCFIVRIRFVLPARDEGYQLGTFTRQNVLRILTCRQDRMPGRWLR